MHDRLERLFARFCDQGDAAALGEVFDACAPQLLRIARHVAPDAGEAEDLVQGTFLAAIEKRAGFDRSRKLAPWLTGILLKQASLARRARARALEADRLAPRSSEDPLDAAGARELSEALTAALARLSPSDRDVLIPLLLDGRRAVEIARELGRRPDTVHMSIHRGLARLRRLLPASFALAAATRAAQARGLDVVRMQVLRHARAELGLSGAVSASVVAGSLGVAMTMKKVALAAGVLGLALSAGGYRLLWRTQEQPVSGVSRDSATLESAQQASAQANLASAPSVAGAQRTSVQGAQDKSSPAGFELLLQREGGEPASAALVALVDATGQVSGAKADARGLCGFTARSGPVEVFVRDDGRLPFHARLESAGAERRTLELPRGEELAGRLWLPDGSAPPRFELQLRGDSAPEGFARANIEVFQALELVRYGAPRFDARLQTHTDGSFKFQGLPQGWSGGLFLPKELVFVVGGLPTTESARPVAAASRAMALPIAWRPRILGRLIESASGLPLAEAEFEGAVQWSDGGSTIHSARTNAQGRFTIALDYRTDAVGLELQGIRSADKGLAHAGRLPKWDGPCEPFDAGDIECVFPAARALEFHAVDAAGKALAGARGAIDRLSAISANAAGVGVFAAVPLDAQELRVVAPGHAIARVALTPETVSPLRLVLAPANRLTLLLPREAQGRRGLYVELLSRPLLFGGRSRMYDAILRGGMIGNCWSADGDSGTQEGAVRLGFSEQGRIEVEDIRSGVPFRVRLRGSEPLSEIAIDALGPTEQRVIEFSHDCMRGETTHAVRGLVEDEQGRPLLDARIATCFACGRSSATSGPDGGFRIDLSSADPLDIEVSKRGFVPFRARAWDVRSEQLLRARLRRGKDLRVELVDAMGRAIDGAYLSAEVEGFGPPGSIEGGPPGVFTLCDLPEGSVRIVARVAGQLYAEEHDTSAGVARLLLPEHARLEVSWLWREPADDAKDYRLVLRPQAGVGAEQIGWTPFPERVLRHEFASVLPGEYTLGFEVGSPNADGSDLDYAPLQEAVHVKLVGGQTTRVELRP